MKISPNESSVPNHLGLILDGNRRWAKAQNLPSLEGHRRGYDNLKSIVEAALNRGVKVVSAYIFSIENWQRSKKEVKYLMDLALNILQKDVLELHQKNIKVVWLGSPQMLSEKIIKAITKAQNLTKNNDGGTLALCFNYGGWQEIAEATQKLIDQKGVNISKIDSNLFKKHLYHPEIPELDLIIRTSGEQRISGFMLYRAAYAELIFSSKYWPAYTVQDLEHDLAEYARRQRRYGK